MHSLKQLLDGDLAGARRLKLSEGLTEFPEAIYSLADTLETLDLSGNQLTTLPDDLYRFKQLKVLFVSNNPLQSLPEGLDRCESLDVAGFKHCQIKEVTAANLPPNLRWLILTDNRIERLPANIGDLTRMEKLALAGNQLSELPESMIQMKQLGLLRISANRLTAFPDFLLELPNLAWLAFAGNPFCAKRELHADFPQVSLSDLALGDTLGRGASGVISLAMPTNPVPCLNADESLAVKIFHGDMTSDGYPEDELDACLCVPPHPNLVSTIARISDPERDGVVMKLIPESYTNLGLPPTLESCTRDVFRPGQTLTQSDADHLCQQMTKLVEHLEAAQVCHGDLYAHNTLVAPDGHLLFGDFGAASRYHHLSREQIAGIRRIERRSLAHFIDDVQSLVRQP